MFYFFLAVDKLKNYLTELKGKVREWKTFVPSNRSFVKIGAKTKWQKKRKIITPGFIIQITSKGSTVIIPVTIKNK